MNIIGCTDGGIYVRCLDTNLSISLDWSGASTITLSAHYGAFRVLNILLASLLLLSTGVEG